MARASSPQPGSTAQRGSPKTPPNGRRNPRTPPPPPPTRSRRSLELNSPTLSNASTNNFPMSSPIKASIADSLSSGSRSSRSDSSSDDEGSPMEIDTKDSRSIRKRGAIRRPAMGFSTRTVHSDIMAQSMNDSTSYTLSTKSIIEQGNAEHDFVGDAYYYHLARNAIRNKVHGTYLIVYARKDGIEVNENGFAFEPFEPSIMNTLCIYTKQVKEKTDGHRKVNELLQQGLYGVGMLHLNDRNITFWIRREFNDNADLAIQARIVTKQTTPPPTYGTELETALRNPNTSEDESAILEFGARQIHEIANVSKGNEFQGWGFEFVKVNVPYWTEKGLKANHHFVAVKVPENGGTPSAFLLNQALGIYLEDSNQWFQFVWLDRTKALKAKDRYLKAEYKRARTSMPRLKIAPRALARDALDMMDELDTTGDHGGLGLKSVPFSSVRVERKLFPKVEEDEKLTGEISPQEWISSKLRKKGDKESGHTRKKEVETDIIEVIDVDEDEEMILDEV